MMSRDTQTYFSVDFEAAAGREEAEGGRFERVGGREDDAAVVEAAGEGGRGWRAPDCEVPFEEVGFEGCGVVVWAGLGGEFGGFAQDAFEGGGF